MRYLFAVIANQLGEVLADHDEMTKIDAFNDKIEAAGQRVMAAGIASPDHAITFDNRGGRDQEFHGQAINSELFMAGFWVIEAESDTIAHALAAEASFACNRLIEVRPFLH
jgi:hypothetical protein